MATVAAVKNKKVIPKPYSQFMVPVGFFIFPELFPCNFVEVAHEASKLVLTY